MPDGQQQSFTDVQPIAQSFTDVTPIGQPAKPDTGILAGLKRNTVGMVSGLYHAFTDPASDQEKQELMGKVRAERERGENISDDLATNPSRATLAYHRLIDAPADVLAKKGNDEQAAAKDLLSQGKTWKGNNLYTSGMVDQGLAAVPMAGPWLNSVAERYEKGDKSGAATDVASALAFSNAKPLAKAAARGAASVLPDASTVASKLYQSALKPPPGSYSTPEVASMVKTGLENKIPVSSGGIDRLNGLVADLNSKIKATIDAGAARGATVNKFSVASRLGQTADKFATQVTPESDLNAVGQTGNEFLRNQPNEIPASRAQALKQGTYQQLGDKSYGELSSATIESQKALARGIKEELAQQFPEIAGMNAKESQLFGLEPALERAVRRIDNHDIISLGSKVAAGAGAAFGGAPGAVAAGLMEKVLGLPLVKSKLAIMINHAGKGSVPMNAATGRIEAYVTALQNAAQPRQQLEPAMAMP